MTDKEIDKLNEIAKMIHSGECSFDFLVQNIELSLSYSNGMVASVFAKKHGISYNGAIKETKTRKVRKIGGALFCFEYDKL